MPRRVLLLFVDGIGLGENAPDRNPMAATAPGSTQSPPLRILGLHRAPGRDDDPFDASLYPPAARGGRLVPLDAAMGVAGLPQSATGQTAILTGVNAPRLLGRHLSGFPNQRLREILASHSLLKQLADHGWTAQFVNVFRPLFFEEGEHIQDAPLSVTTHANRAAGLPFHRIEDIAARRAIYQEFTNAHLREAGYDLPLFEPEEAGAILARASERADFTLYEYFQSDKAGHSMDFERGLAETRKLDRFLDAVLSEVNLGETLVILASDHGNLEDMSTRSHTRNPAIGIFWGEGASPAAGAGARGASSAARAASPADAAGSVMQLTELTPIVLSTFGLEALPDPQSRVESRSSTPLNGGTS